MKLDEIISDLKGSVEGAVNSVDSRFENRYMAYLVPQFCSSVISDVYNGTRSPEGTRLTRPNKLLPGILTMNVELTKDRSIQESTWDYVLFEIAAPIELDLYANGFTFLGTENSTNSFTQVRSHEHLVILKNKGYRDGKTMYYLFDWPNQLKVYGNTALKKCFARYIPANPVDVPNFDPDNDQYPFPESWMPMLRDKFRSFLLLAEQTVPDIIRNENPMTK